MKYLVLVRWQETDNSTWNERIREFADYDDAFTYAKEQYDAKAANISVCIYELHDCFC